MKKIGFLLVLLLCIFITGCGTRGTKEVGTLSNFESTAMNQGFMVSDNAANYEGIDYIIGAMIANKNDITIEMVIYDTNENAEKALQNHINTFKNYRSSGSTTKKDEGENYYKYEFISNGYYMVSSRIDNTLVFSKTLLANKETVEGIMTSMNY